MHSTVLRFLSAAGVLAPIWMVVGVMVAASHYPGYSHFSQALSELGAQGSPTHYLSPAINNYPLAFLFAAFGVAICIAYKKSGLALVSGVLIIIHGLGTFIAGYHACDVGCDVKSQSPSINQQIHLLAGALMFVSLAVANAIWIKVGDKLLGTSWFSRFSLLCLVLSLLFVGLMLGADNPQQGVGLYQRLNYGASLLWMLVLAWLTSSRTSSMVRHTH